MEILLISIGPAFKPIDWNNPAIDFPDRGRIERKSAFGIMLHDDVQGPDFLPGIIQKMNLPVTQNASVFHAPRTGYLLTLVSQFMVSCKINAYIRMPFQDVNLFSFLSRMEINSIICKSKVHWNQVWHPCLVNHGNLTKPAGVDYPHHLLFLINRPVSHFSNGSG
jgi:hypothetical protein